MPEAERELAELKREVVEARNQSIKTDNRVQNLSLDVRGFEKRFDLLEKRTRLASVGAMLVVAVAIAGAAYAIHAVRVSSLSDELKAAKGEGTKAQETAQKKVDQIRKKLAAAEQSRSRRETAEALLRKVRKHVAERRERDAVDLLAQLQMEHLTPLCRELAADDLGDLKRRAGEQAYKAARGHLAAGRLEAAVVELRRSLKLDNEGRYEGPARYLVAVNLWHLRRFDEAIPHLKVLLNKESDRALLDEVRYYLATALAHLGRHEEAKPMFAETVSSRFGSSSRAYLAALEGGTELPALPNVSNKARRKIDNVRR